MSSAKVVTKKRAVKKASRATWRSTKLDPHKELSEIAQELRGDEVRILVRVARRLWVGRQRYGEMVLKNDKRDYQKEASEELLDWLVYTEMDLERKSQKKRR